MTSKTETVSVPLALARGLAYPGDDFHELVDQLQALLAAPAEDVRAMVPTKDFWREQLLGVEVSVDVSTCDEDAGNRLFGTVSEVMDHPASKHGFILLVHDQEPNFDVRAVVDEPVYQTCNGVSGWIDVDLLRYTACQLDTEEYETRVLHRHPQRQFVMPEHHEDRCDSSEAEAYQNGWNACLDEIARLNK